MMKSRGSEWNRWDLHVHTASSYDYKYKAPDADALLCQALEENNVKAVAITDHFKIDKNRIEGLRSKAPGIVFFPGVELRTDKGSNNLHLVLVFSEKADLTVLSEDFDAIMMRSKAKSAESNETIYWEFGDIVDFAKSHDALISIHAGHKTNGIDKEISNILPVNEAIKADIAGAIHFFEVGQKRDINAYEQHIFKDTVRRPLIICSDNHNPKDYTAAEMLWIKADLTFAGLKQCLYQPQERVFIGNIPPGLDRVRKNKQYNISAVSCMRIDRPTNEESTWFDFNIPLNSSMVAVIGNKGSGKSAFSDIIGHLCHCKTMESASFLNDRRFRKLPKNYANDYSATLTWFDGEICTDSLGANSNKNVVEDAQYLPQKYIEDVCNDFGDIFQKEIDKVIFSYVDKVERGEAQSLDELVQLQSKSLDIRFQDERLKLADINSRIVKLEKKKTKGYKIRISESLKKANETLKRHEKSLPAKVSKPEQKDSESEYQEKLCKLNKEIQEAKVSIKRSTDRISEINMYINDIQTVVAQISLLKTQFGEVQNQIESLIRKYGLKRLDLTANLIPQKAFLENLIAKAKEEKKSIQDFLSAGSSFYQRLKNIETERDALISSADTKEKLYQKYLADLTEWEEKKSEIIGNKDAVGSIKFFEYELDYINTKLDAEYRALLSDRNDVAMRIYEGISGLSKIYRGIYEPVQGEISQLLGTLEDGIHFQAEVFMKEANLAQNILSFINQKFNGKFGRSHNSIQEIETCIKNIDFGNVNSVVDFLHDMSEVITSDFETAEKRVQKRQEFYDFIFGLKYIGVNFNLKMGMRSLDELSPGERGMVLLVFYLALSKERKPIIIDQPEDNLDNQSIYSKLVPCICRAKQKRQVIVVTHNPNIAVACDAEQIIYCEKNKITNHISYASGAIENPVMRNHVVDVLEGTMPAFDLRSLKYAPSA